jgi:hypothetical protein
LAIRGLSAIERIRASKQETRWWSAYLATTVKADDALKHILWRLVCLAVRSLRLQQFEQF